MPERQDDYEKTYAEFWQGIVENPDGTLNRDQVMRELHDYQFLLQEVPKVYDHVTGGRVSKPNTYAFEVTSLADEHYHADTEARS